LAPPRTATAARKQAKRGALTSQRQPCHIRPRIGRLPQSARL